MYGDGGIHVLYRGKDDVVMSKEPEKEKTLKDAEPRYFIDKDIFICKGCGGIMRYEYAGLYKCEDCGKRQLDTFGKVKLYIEENGPTPALIIAESIGVNVAEVNNFLREGRLEIPEGADHYIPCEKCGCDIRYGRFCPDCVKSLSGDLRKAFFMSGAGEKPKKSGGEKMHFLNKNR